VGVPAQQQVLEHRGVLEQLDVLEGARDAAPGDLVRGHAGDVLVAEDEPPVGGLVDARDEVEDGGLARAVGPDDREHLAHLDLEGHRVDGPDAAEAHPEVVGREEGHRRRSERM
jgi:hypothetical protein